jgi:hypothetical protein
MGRSAHTPIDGIYLPGRRRSLSLRSGIVRPRLSIKTLSECLGPPAWGGLRAGLPRTSAGGVE